MAAFVGLVVAPGAIGGTVQALQKIPYPTFKTGGLLSLLVMPRVRKPVTVFTQAYQQTVSPVRLDNTMQMRRHTGGSLLDYVDLTKIGRKRVRRVKTGRFIAPVLPAGPSSALAFRKTLSLIGSAIGKRQMQVS